MYQFFTFMIQIIKNLLAFLDSFSFDVPVGVGNLTITYLQLIEGFLILGFIIFAFWKGAKT